MLWIRLPRSRRGDDDQLSEALLPLEHVHGLPSSQNHVRLALSAVALAYLLSSSRIHGPFIYPVRPSRPTCLFLALKTENHLVPIDAFISRFSKLNAAEILQLEFLVAQSLKFEFSVWHAHKALRGFWLDLQVGLAYPLVSFQVLNDD